MRFSYQVGMCEPDHYLSLARAAEEAGFDGICVNEHHQNGYGLMPSPNLAPHATSTVSFDR